ncbi:hypothetical protein [Burkholderia cenocepacia]|uniref:hypothetical protein n=1 Tax=Burkholderia cenocepacia TaxID=95486 RepID=UPI000761FA2A|nr:hypothetical protein [Burkholderia cenocepacia]KWU19100.1 hypothetical protein AS149_12700 [Burkholderia cenocepacia]
MLPQAVLAAAGLSHEVGLDLSVKGNRVLVTAGTNNYDLMTIDPSKRARLLFKHGLPAAVRNGKYALVYGSGYLVLTTPGDAGKMAPNAVQVVSTNKHGRMANHALPVAFGRTPKVELSLVTSAAPAKPLPRKAPVRAVQKKARTPLALVTDQKQPVSGAKVERKPSKLAQKAARRVVVPAPTVLPAMSGIRVKYPALAKWPALEAAEAVHTHIGTRTVGYLALPIRIAREAGLDPVKGLHVASYNGRLLAWSDANGGPVKSHPETKQLHLRYGELRADARGENVAIVRGNGYLIVTSKEDAVALAPNVECIEKKKIERIDGAKTFVSNRDLTLKAEEILAWKDFNSIVGGTVFMPQGNIFGIAGMVPGDSVRFFRYNNALVMEKSTEAQGHSVIAQLRDGLNLGRHFIGSTLFKVQGTVMRIIASRDRIVACDPNSDIAKLCDAKRLLPKGNTHSARKFVALHPGATVNTVDAIKEVRSVGALSVNMTTNVSPLVEKNSAKYPLNRTSRRVQIQGAWLRAYGFVPGARYDLSEHPLIRGRVLATLSENGAHQVTTMSGTTPKLYVPMDAVAHFKSTHLEVFGTHEGLHIKQDLTKGGTVKSVQGRRSSPMTALAA